MAVFIVGNFVIGTSFNNEVNLNIASIIKINQASAQEIGDEGYYGNDLDGNCQGCIIGKDSNGKFVHGVRIRCYYQQFSYCVETECGYGFC